jgi:hypothetical protein
MLNYEDYEGLQNSNINYNSDNTKDHHREILNMIDNHKKKINGNKRSEFIK